MVLVDEFVPDEKMQHDFYKVANEIMNNPLVSLTLTKDADDICRPCVKCYQGICQDDLPKELGNIKKDEYNHRLDQRIIDYLDLHQDNHTAIKLCEIINQYRDVIFQVWKEENDELTQKRYVLFCKGADRYLKKYKD